MPRRTVAIGLSLDNREEVREQSSGVRPLLPFARGRGRSASTSTFCSRARALRPWLGWPPGLGWATRVRLGWPVRARLPLPISLRSRGRYAPWLGRPPWLGWANRNPRSLLDNSQVSGGPSLPGGLGVPRGGNHLSGGDRRQATARKSLADHMLCDQSALVGFPAPGWILRRASVGRPAGHQLGPLFGGPQPDKRCSALNRWSGWVHLGPPSRQRTLRAIVARRVRGVYNPQTDNR
jgi:hypothetical protein